MNIIITLREVDNGVWQVEVLIMKFDDDLGMYAIEIDGIVFVSEDELEVEYMEKMKTIADNYWSNLPFIIEFMLPDLEVVYGSVDIEIVKEKLGRPFIDFENGKVDYLEQTFDDMHIFTFEFLDDAFKELQYFSIDG